MDFLFFFQDFLSKFYDLRYIEILIQRNCTEIINYFKEEKNILDDFINFNHRFYGINISSIVNINQSLDVSKNNVLYLNNKNVDLLFSMFHFYINSEGLKNSTSSIDDFNQDLILFFNSHLDINHITEINFFYNDEYINPSSNPANFYSFSLVILYLCDLIFYNLKCLKIGFDESILCKELFYVDFYSHYLTLCFFIYSSDKQLSLKIDFNSFNYSSIENYTYNCLRKDQMYGYINKNFSLDYKNLLKSILTFKCFDTIGIKVNYEYLPIFDYIALVEENLNKKGLEFKKLSIITSYEFLKKKDDIKNFFKILRKIFANKSFDLELEVNEKQNFVNKYETITFSIKLNKFLQKLKLKKVKNLNFSIKIPDSELILSYKDLGNYNLDYNFKRFHITTNFLNTQNDISFLIVNCSNLKLHTLNEKLFKNVTLILEKQLNNYEIKSLDLKIIAMNESKIEFLREDLNRLMEAVRNTKFVKKLKLTIESSLVLSLQESESFLKIFNDNNLKLMSIILEKSPDLKKEFKKSTECYKFYENYDFKGKLNRFYIQNTDIFH